MDKETNPLVLEGLDSVPTPSLTLEPAETQEPMQPVKKVEPIEAEEEKLTPQEKKMVEDFAQKIDITNTSQVLQYGAGAQKKIADFSETALDNVKTKDMGEVGEMLTNLIGELKGFNADEEEKGFLGIFKRASNKIQNMRVKYDKASANVERICGVLEEHQIQLLKDIAMLDKMYDMNLAYFKELTMYILAGKKKLQSVRDKELPEAVSRAKHSGLPEDAQAANDLSAMCNSFEKKLHDLELTRMVSVQMAPQLRLVQNNDSMMADKIQSTLVNTIPLWKSQMVLALGIAHSQQAIAAQREVTDMTNELLRKNADTLKMGTIEAAKESERGIVDIETLQHTNEQLISTLDEVFQIQQEGRQKRHDAEIELQRIEGELKQKLLDVRGQ
ncbi:MAG TPA: toxic anion resistance protein [Candidatus Gallacutalibacter stercoravium]|nr:toxic anion resistance protein [Candidatus Gallacutalibacter stercoravium]